MGQPQQAQAPTSVDGFTEGPDVQLDWLTWHLDEELKSFIRATNAIDNILFGESLTDNTH